MATRAATAAIACGDGDDAATAGRVSSPIVAPSSRTRSIGTLSTTGRHSSRARRNARIVSSPAVSALQTRSTAAPVSRANAAWSTLKFDHSVAAGVSAATTSIGVWLFAASVMCVSVFVKPGPWWTLTAATRPVARA